MLVFHPMHPQIATTYNARHHVLLEELADEQGKNRATEQELKRLQDHDKDWELKERKGIEDSVRTKGTQDRAAQSYQSTLATDPPPMRKGHYRINRSAAFPKFESLPDNVQDIIFGMLLKSPVPIKLNTRRLVDFVKRDVGIPYSSSSTRKQKRRINVLEPPNNLRLELANMKAYLIQISLRRWPSASVVKGLTLSLLLVSKAVHKKAAKCFYGNNVLDFSDARNAWMHLESFLNTIGPRNVSNMQQLSIAMPNWFHDLASDRVALALLNAISRVTRLAAGNNFAETPLPSAISSCTSILGGHSGLKSFQIDISLRDVPSFVDSNLLNRKEQFSAEEKVLMATRRDDSIQLLGALITALRPSCNTKLIVHADKESKKGRKKFNRFLPQIQLEAEKFGLEVNRVLDVSGKLRAFGNV